MVALPGAAAAAPGLIAEFADRYANRNTRRQYVCELGDLFASTGRTHPRQLTETDVLRWAGDRRLANNTIRSRLSRVCTFLRWCIRQGEAEPALVEALMGRDNPLRRTPRLYGKVQGKYPARWLTRDEAFGTLLGTCADGTDAGLRDELLLRLGLAGMRAAEIMHLRIDNLHLTHTPPTIDWMGKASRSRRLVIGKQLGEALSRYLDLYASALGRSLRPSDPLICRERPGSGAGSVSWGRPIAQTCSVRRIVLLRAEAAGLGHLSPHDLRRTAAGILHHSTDAAGAHHFDLLDIQKVLGHADPATTMRSYLDPLDTGVIERAASVTGHPARGATTCNSPLYIRRPGLASLGRVYSPRQRVCSFILAWQLFFDTEKRPAVNTIDCRKSRLGLGDDSQGLGVEPAIFQRPYDAVIVYRPNTQCNILKNRRGASGRKCADNAPQHLENQMLHGEGKDVLVIRSKLRWWRLMWFLNCSRWREMRNADHWHKPAKVGDRLLGLAGDKDRSTE